VDQISNAKKHFSSTLTMSQVFSCSFAEAYDLQKTAFLGKKLKFSNVLIFYKLSIGTYIFWQTPSLMNFQKTDLS
jgi:hypothetical protein